MNIFEVQERLKDFSKDQLVNEMQMPSGTAPPYLVLSELQRRTRMEQSMMADGQEAPQTTVMEDAVSAAGMPQGGLQDMARAMAPQTDMTGNTGATPVQTMQEGGEVRSTGAQVQSVIDQVMGGGATNPVVPQMMSFADRAAQLPVMAPPQAVQPQQPNEITSRLGGPGLAEALAGSLERAKNSSGGPSLFGPNPEALIGAPPQMPDMSSMDVGELAGIMNSAPDRATREAALEAMTAMQGPGGGFVAPQAEEESDENSNDPRRYIANPQAEGYIGKAEGGVMRYQEGGRVDVPGKVATDPAVIAMANRMGMSVQEYLNNLDPEARRQLVRNAERRENMDLSGDDAAYDAFMDRTQNYLELPSQEDLDNRFSRQQQDERFGFSNVPSQMQPPAEGAGLTGISDMRSYREQLRDMGRQSVATGARLQPPTMQSPLPAERFATMSTEGSVGPYTMPEMIDDQRAARTRAYEAPTVMDSPLLGERAGEVMPDPGLRDDERAVRGFGRTSYMSGLMEPADSPGFLSEGASSIFDYIPDVNAGINAITDFASPYRLADSISRAREELATTDDPNVRRGLESQISSMESLSGASEAMGENVIAPATDAVTDAGALAMRAVSNPLLRGAGRVASAFSPGVGGAVLGLADTASEIADRLALAGQGEGSGAAVDMAAEAERSAEEAADLRDEAGITQSLPSPATRTAPAGPGGGGGAGAGAGATGVPANAPMSDNERMLNQDKWLSLARVGLGLMSSQAPTFGQALGEAGAAGLDSLNRAREDYLERKQAEEMMALRRAAAAGRGGGGGAGGMVNPFEFDLSAGGNRALERIDSVIERLQMEQTQLGEDPGSGFFGLGGPDAEWTRESERLNNELAAALAARNQVERGLQIGALGGSVAGAAPAGGVYSTTDVR